MRADRLAQLGTFGVGFDLETHRIQPGLVSPPIVLGSLAVSVGGEIRGELLDLGGVRRTFDRILADRRLTLVMANGSFDLLCLAVDGARRGVDLLPQIFDLYDPGRCVLRAAPDGRVFDVLIAETLHSIAEGLVKESAIFDPSTGRKLQDPATGRELNRISLSAATWLVLGRRDAKTNDRFRESYALFDGWSLDRMLAEMPPEAREYPVDDARNQLEVGLGQAGFVPAVHAHTWQGDRCAACDQPGARLCRTRRPRRNLHEVARQSYAAFAMALGAAWGFTVDQDAVDAVEAKYNAEHQRDLRPFVDAGILRPDGSENQAVLKRRVAWAYGAREACPTCAGTSKVPSEKTGKPVQCKGCGATGLVLTEMVPRTDTGGVKTDKDALEESGDDLLVDYEASCSGAKIPTTYLPYLRHQAKEHDILSDGRCARCSDPSAKRCQPANWRSLPLILRPNPIVATGRGSYSDPAQQFPRGWGLRECIVARTGTLLSSIDYKAGELVTHSQNCLDLVGASELARALNAGLDAHLALAATMLGKLYEWALEHKKDKEVKNGRQAAKPPNFGFPGGMGPQKLVLTQRRQGPDTPHESGPSWIDDGKGGKVRGYRGLRFCLLMGRADRCGEVKLTSYRDRPIAPTCKACLECAEDIKRSWLKQWPENAKYFRLVNEWNDRGEVEQMVTRRVRGGIDYCSAANGMFQGRLADAAKNALCAIQRECYDRTCRVPGDAPGAKLGTVSAFAGGPSPLLGSHVIVFQHDEVISEHPESVAHEAATRAGEIMVEALRIICPDMGPAVEAEPALMPRWYKGAEPLFHGGRLAPWTPEHDAKTCPECKAS